MGAILYRVAKQGLSEEGDILGKSEKKKGDLTVQRSREDSSKQNEWQGQRAWGRKHLELHEDLRRLEHSEWNSGLEELRMSHRGLIMCHIELLQVMARSILVLSQWEHRGQPLGCFRVSVTRFWQPSSHLIFKVTETNSILSNRVKHFNHVFCQDYSPY